MEKQKNDSIDSDNSGDSTESQGTFDPSKPISIEQLKEKVLEQVRAAGVTEKDPLFEILNSTGRLEMLLMIIPKAFDQVFFSWLKTIRHELEAYEAAALKGQQMAIARCVEELVASCAGDRHAGSARGGQIPLNWVALGAGVGLAFGLILGLYVPTLMGKASNSSQKLSQQYVLARPLGSG